MGLVDQGWAYKTIQLSPVTIPSEQFGIEEGEFAEIPQAREDLTYDNPKLSRTLLVNWNERQEFLDDLLGYSYLESNVVKRIHPDPHPDYPQYRCLDAVVNPLGLPAFAAGTVGKYISVDFAVIQATYTPVNYSIGDSTFDYFSFTMEPMTEYLTLQGMMYYANTNGAWAKRNVGFVPGKQVNSLQMSCTWHRVPGRESDPYVQPCLDATRDLLGKLNDTPIRFRSGGETYPKGTVLFQGVQDQFRPPRNNTEFSSTMYDLSFKFKIIDNGVGKVLSSSSVVDIPADGNGNVEHAGHNFRWSPQSNAWLLVTADPGGVSDPKVYEYGEMADLFDLS